MFIKRDLLLCYISVISVSSREASFSSCGPAEADASQCTLGSCWSWAPSGKLDVFIATAVLQVLQTLNFHGLQIVISHLNFSGSSLQCVQLSSF